MPDEIQAEPPQLAPEPATGYDRFDQVNLRKPRSSSPRWWAILVAVGVTLGLVLLLLTYQISMRKGVAVVTTTAPIPAPAASGGAASDLRELEGIWTATGVVIDGEELDDADLAQVRLTISWKGYQMALPMTTHRGDWDVDPTARPQELDLVGGDEAMLAIYRLQGETLTICLAPHGQPRPRELDAPKGSDRTLLHLKRLKDERGKQP